jgi:hypothetical protein
MDHDSLVVVSHERGHYAKCCTFDVAATIPSSAYGLRVGAAHTRSYQSPLDQELKPASEAWVVIASTGNAQRAIKKTKSRKRKTAGSSATREGSEDHMPPPGAVVLNARRLFDLSWSATQKTLAQNADYSTVLYTML